MDFTLTEEQRLFQKTVKVFAEKEIEPVAQKIDKEGVLPDILINKMAALKLLGMTIPNAYGGGDAGNLDAVLAIEQIAYSGTGAWWLPAFCGSIPGSIIDFGTEAQKKAYIQPVCEGRTYPSIQFTEAGTGSDPRALTTTAVRKGNHFVISGMKRFSTFGARNGFAVLYAKDDTGKCTAFIIEKFQKGYSTGSNYALMGSGGIEAADVFFEDVWVPEENILGQMGDGLSILLSWIADEKIQQCGACLGIAQAALDEAVTYAQSKELRTGVQTDLQGIRWMLAEMYAKLEASRWMTYRAAVLKDQPASNWINEAAAAKLFVIPTTMEVVELSRRIHGAYGYTKEFKIERLYRAIAGASAIAAGLEINKTIVAGALLK